MPDVGQRSEKRQRTELVGVRLTPVEKAQLLETATSFGMSVGELIRWRCLHA